jgi:hypothetical protein
MVSANPTDTNMSREKEVIKLEKLVKVIYMKNTFPLL